MVGTRIRYRVALNSISGLPVTLPNRQALIIIMEFAFRMPRQILIRLKSKTGESRYDKEEDKGVICSPDAWPLRLRAGRVHYCSKRTIDPFRWAAGSGKNQSSRIHHKRLRQE